jgi:phosphoadenosine phosphosulfate reductase
MWGYINKYLSEIVGLNVGRLVLYLYIEGELLSGGSMSMSENEIKKNLERWKSELSGTTAEEIIRWSGDQFGNKAAFASSMGLEDQMVYHLIYEHAPEIPVFTLDTGRLFPETYDLISKTENKYGLKIIIYFPEAEEVQQMTSEHGVNLFRKSVELRKKCCVVRKINPLRRALNGKQAWITGLRRSQSVTRTGMDVIEWDSANGLYKINPLVDWSEEQTRDYLKENNIPYNPLHDRGYPSIGCSCCTRAVAPGEDVRAGRWWWESPEHKECGLHLKSEKQD